MLTILQPAHDALSRVETRRLTGTVASVRGLTIMVDDLPLPVGALVRLEAGMAGRRRRDESVLRGEVVGFCGAQSIVILFSQSSGVSPGMRVVGEQSAQMIGVSERMRGRVINALGEPIDGAGPIGDLHLRSLHPAPLQPLQRSRIAEPLPCGVRAIDGFLTLGRGQRMGVFSAAGVGKSTLLGSIARNTAAEVNVIALIGERGREVREFIEESLGEEGLRRSVIVAATSDESPLLRLRAAFVACAIAEFFRDGGCDVMLMMDSITRFAQAQRQVGLAAGEQPATRGYTPSVFAMLPVLLERAGAIEGGGSITGIYAVLVEGDDMDEPVSDAARGVLDGHIVLSRGLASRGHYPAIDVLESISRVAADVSDQHHRGARAHLIRLLAAYREFEELINIGAYAKGSNPDCDVAIAMRPQLLEFLKQERQEPADFPRTCRQMIELSGLAEQHAARVTTK